MFFIQQSLFALLLLLALPGQAAQPVVDYQLAVRLEPSHGQLAVRATLHLPPELAAQRPLHFSLHAGLAPRLVQPAGARLERVRRSASPGGSEWYRLYLPAGTSHFSLEYAGAIARPLLPAASPGETVLAPLSERGVQLGEASQWYPQLAGTRQRFVLDVTLPATWRTVSQGVREASEVTAQQRRERWRETAPQQGITLMAGPFYEYREEGDGFLAYAFLRADDPALAQRYLGVTAEYVDFYSRLLGPYPYAKFAVVENFWESGLGLPSYTLLGSQVLRLPFILHTSYPHEILHNWWGNGVYVDYETGNWGEGLTSYLADHLLRERRGEGGRYRHQTLQRYSNYVSSERDFSLREFRVRHSEVTQAVGYDKTLMLFHMLRRQLGDERFIAGLRHLYREQLFQTAGFDEVRYAFEAVSGEDLAQLFQQWVERAGAPSLQLSSLRSERLADGSYRLSGLIRQVQDGPAFVLQVPIELQLEGDALAHERLLEMNGRELAFSLELPARPWRLYVDRHYDLMRRLDPLESPPVFSRLFGAEQTLWVLPAAAPAPLREAYRALAETGLFGGVSEIRLDEELDGLPDDRAVWLLGWENRWRKALDDGLAAQGVSHQARAIRLPDGELAEPSADGLALVLRQPGNVEQAIGWLAFEQPEALADLARRLRHYGSYGYLLFSGMTAENRLRGRWQQVDSPLWAVVAQHDGATPPASHAASRPRSLLDVLAD